MKAPLGMLRHSYQFDSKMRSQHSFEMCLKRKAVPYSLGIFLPCSDLCFSQRVKGQTQTSYCLVCISYALFPHTSGISSCEEIQSLVLYLSLESSRHLGKTADTFAVFQQFRNSVFDRTGQLLEKRTWFWASFHLPLARPIDDVLALQQLCSLHFH